MKVTQIFASALKSAPAIAGSSMLAAGVFALSAPANALTNPCSATIASKVQGTSACEFSPGESQDFLNSNPMTVNQVGFFSFTDWVFGGKSDNVNAKTGTWNISSLIQSNWGDVMLVFKAGNDPLTAYLVKDGVTSGKWDSPFPIQNNNFRDISHISVYYRPGEEGPGTEVPEPGSLAALAIAGGFIVSRGRKALKNA
ncbi:PEP-CTERM sorting domain-containing protein [Desertifilum sp. FACHB-1129]|uniref:PEP-CTERM protein-sorting domain-containing protein n=2 Tax=Desertifilum tharense IPPAS B-1220 TaxID=1781255 RepID=A0A1E5QKM2_9CYAN|nr:MULTISPECIES: PEP-CTERM sorting domain-containing protein [Desertifilum]MCD8489237.1 PEP-CTERM sorting domain-containing protein [Desertifilum sp.]MDA0211133.1 PEP-CTERM sorting domain-containing protein [Cyanobacteria bacterium FC1]MBD2315180.1 PEP-CTERM sorting domain-containing protein [Desertifilum sp. FACHB-1129]MBD2320096.1 PEP-CTERM sorting domain-containing protein [Desertifilum sp. FACHB-866]MBD2330224.1 PEP-CTERM sorting domain-containing protein [Desertifilum sp. FACHB-868]